MTLVSVLVAAYNHEAYIAECLDSVLAVHWKPKELVVWDDGSTDRTLAIAQEWAARHAGDIDVRVMTAPNQGASAVLNELLELARGDYIVTLASDDRLAPGGIRVLARALETGAGAAFGDARVIDPAGAVVREWFMPERVRDRMRHDLVRELIVNWSVAGPVLMYRRGLVGHYDKTLRVEDWDLYLRLAATGRLRFVNEIVADYRVHGRNESLNPATERQRATEARRVAMRRARDFRGVPRLLLLAKAMYLAVLGSPLEAPIRAVRRRLA